MLKLKKILSGGQTGADVDGLKAAKKLGLETGGMMPKGFRTLDGPRKDYADLYGIEEHTSWSYPPRTAANAKNSDATIRFAANFDSAGEKCTLRFINQYKRPYLDIDVTSPLPLQYVRDWLEKNNISTLNIAGNSEKSSPGIEEFVFNYLVELLEG